MHAVSAQGDHAFSSQDGKTWVRFQRGGLTVNVIFQGYNFGAEQGRIALDRSEVDALADALAGGPRFQVTRDGFTLSAAHIARGSALTLYGPRGGVRSHARFAPGTLQDLLACRRELV